MTVEYRIEADIPFGNVAAPAVSDTGKGTTVAFAAHPRGGPESLWFCFRIRRVGGKGDRKPLCLRLLHLDTMLGLSAENISAIRPVARFDGEEWKRLDGGESIETPDGAAVAEWSIEAPRTFVDVAFCYPYGPDDVDRLVAECRSLKADPIGISQCGRPLIRVSNSCGKSSDDRPGIYCIARQHASETPGGWVLDGLLRRADELGEAAPLVWAVPLADVDGVVLGAYGKDRFPYDLNRAWGHPPMRHETLCCQRDLLRWRNRCRAELALDLHAPGGGETTGVYAFLPVCEGAEGPDPDDRELAEALARAIGSPYAAEDFARIAGYRSRWETPNFARYARGQLGIRSISVETSYQAAGDVVLTIDHYREIGARVVDFLAERFAGA